MEIKWLVGLTEFSCFAVNIYAGIMRVPMPVSSRVHWSMHYTLWKHNEIICLINKDQLSLTIENWGNSGKQAKISTLSNVLNKSSFELCEPRVHLREIKWVGASSRWGGQGGNSWELKNEKVPAMGGDGENCSGENTEEVQILEAEKDLTCSRITMCVARGQWARWRGIQRWRVWGTYCIGQQSWKWRFRFDAKYNGSIAKF